MPAASFLATAGLLAATHIANQFTGNSNSRQLLGDESCTSDLLVYKRGGSLSTTQRNNINNAVDLIPELCWNGTATSSESDLVSMFSTTDFDVVLALNPSNSAPVWSQSTSNALLSIMQNQPDNRLVIFDRYVDNDINVLDLDGLVTRDLHANIKPKIEGVPPATGPGGVLSGTINGNFAAHGDLSHIDFATLQALHPEARSHFVDTVDEESTMVEYCYNSNTLLYSGTPLDFYLSGSGGSNQPKYMTMLTNTLDMVIKDELCGEVDPCEGKACCFYDNGKVFGKNLHGAEITESVDFYHPDPNYTPPAYVDATCGVSSITYKGEPITNGEFEHSLPAIFQSRPVPHSELELYLSAFYVEWGWPACMQTGIQNGQQVQGFMAAIPCCPKEHLVGGRCQQPE